MLLKYIIYNSEKQLVTCINYKINIRHNYIEYKISLKIYLDNKFTIKYKY